VILSGFSIFFQVSFATFLSFILRPMTILVGQVETILPALIAAMEDAELAKLRVEQLKAQLVEVIESPQTVKTCWGSVTLNKGRRTVKVDDRALNAQITLLKESGIALGKCTESVGAPFVTVRKSDR
jgi:hypothetical protein